MKIIESLKALRPKASMIEKEHLLNQEIFIDDPDIKKVSINSRTIIFDLDDTLLNSSLTCQGEWDEDRGVSLNYTSINFSKMKRSPRGWLNFLQGKPKRLQYDSRTYSFLSNPEVHVQFRPGILSCLEQLKSFGNNLYLITASARPRVEFILERFPAFREIFGENIACAEDVAEQVLMIDVESDDCIKSKSKLSDETFSNSLKAHRLRPRSLAIKTPLLFERLFDHSKYDLLVDDSAVTAKYFRESGLINFLLYIEPGKPNSGYGMEIFDAIYEKLSGKSDHLTQLKYSGTYDHILESITMMRLEDPLYFPYLHKSDQLPFING